MAKILLNYFRNNAAVHKYRLQCAVSDKIRELCLVFVRVSLYRCPVFPLCRLLLHPEAKHGEPTDSEISCDLAFPTSRKSNQNVRVLWEDNLYSNSVELILIHPSPRSLEVPPLPQPHTDGQVSKLCHVRYRTFSLRLTLTWKLSKFESEIGP